MLQTKPIIYQRTHRAERMRQVIVNQCLKKRALAIKQNKEEFFYF